MIINNIGSYIDHTILKADATKLEIEKVCNECLKYKFKMIAINPSQVTYCKSILKDSQVHVGAAIGFPLGQNTLKTKIYETIDAIENGSDEIDYVINIGELKDRNYAYIEKEMKEIVNICREKGVISKVIYENCYLTKEEIIKLSEIAKAVRPDFIKTSTGFGTYGARLEDVRLMKSIVGDQVKIKAAGGIRDLNTFMDMIEAGAERIGTSSGVIIVDEYDRRLDIKNSK